MKKLEIICKRFCFILVLFNVFLSCSYASIFKSIIFPEDFAKNYPQTYQLLQTLEISPKAKKLIENIEKRYGDIKVNFSENCFRKGNFSYQTKQMNISTKVLNNPNVFCEVFLWEACNADNIYLTLPSQFSRSNKEYAFFTEAAEHQSLVKCTEILKDYMGEVQEHPILKKLIETSANMDISTIIYKLDNHPLRSFQDYWRSVNTLNQSQEYTHAELYRNFYKENENFLKIGIITNYSPQMLDLIRYSFLHWENNEDIAYISIDTQKSYRKIISEVS